MKPIYCLVVLMLFVACKKQTDTTQAIAVDTIESERTLNRPDLPIEVIAAYVIYVPDLIIVDGQQQLRYELSISNNYRIPFTLTKVEIYNLDNDAISIATFDSDYIDENFERPGIREGDLKVLTANQFGTLHLNVAFDVQREFPKKIYHKLYFDRATKSGEIVTYPMEVAKLTVPPITRNTLGFPFNKKGKWFYEAEGHKGARYITEGKITYPQRFAIDYTFVDENGNFTKGDASQNENWYTYGIELIAIADGTITAINDGIIENIPLSDELAVKNTLETIGGNYVILDIGNDTNAFYGHLIPGSLKVNVGDTIKKGQVLGLLGNSGNSDAPHLHFHLETKNNHFFGGEGMAYLLNSFTQLDTYNENDMSLFLNRLQVPIDLLKPITKNNEFPVGFGLIKIN
ncbi:M23 family metallopeptidase [Patiriisocius marinus]|uniref:M23 family metallopeptidase n=1 Tax=Patiriisocius marinus TaxID=1397112 RepID=UPI00232D0546|nr:M23 family metallopeptidase [Patiriisocius marinus]